MAGHSFTFRKALSFIGIEIKEGPRPSVFGKIVTNIIRKYDANWFVRFLKIAQEEDEASSGASVTDPYKQVAWVNIAVSKRSQNIARSPFRLYSDDNAEREVTTGPIYSLFRDVNPFMSKYQLFEATNSWLDTRGEAFWLFEPDLVGTPKEIWIPNPGDMKAKLDSNNRISLWNYEIKNTKIPYLPDQLIHFKLWNPWNAYRGMNELIALDTELSEDYLSGISNLNLIRNGSVPDGILSSEQRIEEDEAVQIQARWKKNHAGAKKAHTVGVMGQGVEYQQIQATPADMEYFTMKRWSRETVLAKYGIPAVLSGITDTPATLSGDDTKEQMATFWNLALIPRETFIEQKLETDFFERFKIPLIGKFDRSDISELQEDEAKKRQAEREDTKVGLITINEVRDRRGLPPVSWGDVAWFPINLMPADAFIEPAAPPVAAAAPVAVAASYTPIEFMESPKTPVNFLEHKSKPNYTEVVKDAHWKAVILSWQAIERGYAKYLKQWFFDQRSYILEIVTREKAVGSDVLDEISDEAYWATQDAALKQSSRIWFLRAMEASEEHIRTLVETVGLPTIEPSWSIFDTRATELLDNRVSKITRITETMRGQINETMKDAIRDGLSEGDAASLIRDKYNIAQNRVKTIARTEIGGVLGDSRIESYKHFGWEKHEWLDSRDDKVRDEHLMQNQIVTIGEVFDNGLRWPYDEFGAAGNVINCRCLTVPITEE